MKFDACQGSFLSPPLIVNIMEALSWRFGLGFLWKIL